MTNVAPLNLCVDTDLIPFKLSDYEDEVYSMNTYKVIRVLNTIIDTIYEAIDVLIADHDIDIEEEEEDE